MGLDMHIVDEYGNEVAYWRKFNALHNYLVKNLQDGIDDCQRSRQFTKDDVEKILYILKSVDEFPLSAEVLLPSVSGFFFGQTSYDKWYYDAVKGAIHKFQNILEMVEQGEHLYYQSSW
jgi:hypothetical protein